MFRESRLAMDTICTITVVSSSERQAKEAINAGFAEIKRLEDLLNFFSEQSEVTAINKSSGDKPVKVSEETEDIVEKAIKISEYTNGAFDPTIGPLMRPWGFSGLRDATQKTPGIPQTEKIKKILPLIDYKKIKVNNITSEIFLEKKGMELDLGGIVKGYTADRVVRVIKAKGIKSALVSIAGDIKGFGLKPDAEPWKVGIQNPRPEDNPPESPNTPLWKRGVRGDFEDIFASLLLKDKAISTSGDYQRFFIKDGRRYHHILNPKTGFPADRVVSASVIAPDGYMADGISTGIFVLGPEKGIKLLKSLGLSGIIVDTNKKIFLTEDLKGKINIERPL